MNSTRRGFFATLGGGVIGLLGIKAIKPGPEPDRPGDKYRRWLECREGRKTTGTIDVTVPGAGECKGYVLYEPEELFDAVKDDMDRHMLEHQEHLKDGFRLRWP